MSYIGLFVEFPGSLLGVFWVSFGCVVLNSLSGLRILRCTRIILNVLHRSLCCVYCVSFGWVYFISFRCAVSLSGVRRRIFGLRMWATYSQVHQDNFNYVTKVSFLSLLGLFQVDPKNPPPRGGFLFTMFPDQEPGGRGPPLKSHPQNSSILGVVSQGGSSSSRFLIREHSK